KVFDAGATETGRPFFVMEHVAGVSITEHCDRQRLDIEERLNLFMQVCEAVQHAHQKGIIHRDIKPSNVLVTVKEGTPQVKVIDFGVAKAISHRLTEKTIYTEHGQLIGTPEYMSPEQAEMTGLDIDTRTDIYSLGVLLYELLIGGLPFDAKQLRWAGYPEIQRIIREEEPDTPSVRLLVLGGEGRAIADKRRCDLKTMLRTLQGDLDWITIKALDKDRTRRYSSASELTADVRRYLNDIPVLAGPPSARYWLKKFVARHTIGALATSAVVFALLTGIVVSTAFAIGQARARADAVEAVAMLYEARHGRHESAAEAENMLLTVVDILRRLKKEHPTLAAALISLADLQVGQQRFEEAEAALLEARAVLDRAPDTNNPPRHDVIEALAVLYDAWEKPDKAAESRSLAAESIRDRPDP
ncbi:MAG: serine/threonine-protein kinase, partial [Acidobacteria bacterium]|nr:serine/threonine-protein kinase [Acidobacteriota bacterium]